MSENHNQRTAIGRWEGLLVRRSGRAVAMLAVEESDPVIRARREGDYVEISPCPYQPPLPDIPDREPRHPATDNRRLADDPAV